MFQSFIDQAKLSASATVSKYVGRIVVAVLFLVAAGFGLAAISIQLSEAFGPMTAMALLAGVFAVVGVVAYLFALANDRHNQALAHRAAAERTALTTSLVAAAPVALAGGLRLAGRAPLLVAALAVGAYLLSGNVSGVQPRARRER